MTCECNAYRFRAWTSPLQTSQDLLFRFFVVTSKLNKRTKPIATGIRWSILLFLGQSCSFAVYGKRRDSVRTIPWNGGRNSRHRRFLPHFEFLWLSNVSLGEVSGRVATGSFWRMFRYLLRLAAWTNDEAVTCSGRQSGRVQQPASPGIFEWSEEAPRSFDHGRSSLQKWNIRPSICE